MASFTTKLGLRKPNNTTDNVDVLQDLDANWDIVDANIGTILCTSTTRPSPPYSGQCIYETDTKLSYIWSGSVWVLTNAPGMASRYFSGGGQSLTTSYADLTGSSQIIVTVRPNEGIKVDYGVYLTCATSTANAYASVKAQLDGADPTMDSSVIWMVNTGQNGCRLQTKGWALFQPAAAGNHTVKLQGMCTNANGSFTTVGWSMVVESENM